MRHGTGECCLVQSHKPRLERILTPTISFKDAMPRRYKLVCVACRQPVRKFVSLNGDAAHMTCALKLKGI